MDDKNTTPLASEMYADLKETNMFLRKLLIGALVVIGLLVAGLIGTNIYHIYQWSQFDTIVVDSSEGDGNANLIQGDNGGGIYNGADSGAQKEEREVKGNSPQNKG